MSSMTGLILEGESFDDDGNLQDEDDDDYDCDSCGKILTIMMWGWWLV